MANSQHINGDLSVGRNVAVGGKTTIQGNAEVGHNLKVKGWLEAPNIKDINKGVFTSLAALNAAYPNPKTGWVAGVLGVKDEGLETEENVVFLYMAVGGEWEKQEGYEMVFRYDLEQPLDEIYRTLVDNTIGGFSCATAGGVADKVIVTQRGAAGLINWAAFKMSFENANTAASDVTLTVKDEDNVSHGTYPLYYNGAAVTDSNTWESGVEYEVLFDPNADEEGAFFIVRIVRRFDEDPTSGSGNPVTSGGVWHAINDNDVIDTHQMKDAAVTTPKIADENVTWEKLDENTKQLIYAPGGVRIPLAQVFGHDEHIGISQKTLTQTIVPMSTNVTIKILRIHDNTDDVDVSGTVLYVGKNYTVYLDTKMTSVVERFDEVKVYESVGADTEQIDSGADVSEQQTNVVLSTDATFHPNNTNTTYNFFSVGEICGVSGLTSNKVTVNTVYPIYFGANAAGAMTDAIATALTKAPAKTSCAGTYTVDNGADGNYIWFVIPTSISNNKPTAKMNGFEFPLADAQTFTIDDVSYKAYRSVETQESSATAGDYNIVLS